MTKIYLTCFKYDDKTQDVVGYALCEDGCCLASHLSSCEEWSKHDMGFWDSTWKHDIYEKHCPDGFELIWIHDADNDEQWLKAMELNKKWAGMEESA
jgi:hypothetical protein